MNDVEIFSHSEAIRNKTKKMTEGEIIKFLNEKIEEESQYSKKYYDVDMEVFADLKIIDNVIEKYSKAGYLVFTNGLNKIFVNW